MATIPITTHFTYNGAVATGLTPLIYIYDLADNSVEVNGASMTHVANGIYKYSFTTYDYTMDYAVFVDANTANVDVRYWYGDNGNEVWDAATRTLASSGADNAMVIDVTYSDLTHDYLRVKGRV
jgi:hypothetical protein